MNYMIHAAPARMWYVNDFLIPAMEQQGINRDCIRVWEDTDHVGNLASCLASFASCAQQPGGTWHLQDDVIISPDFYAQTQEHDCGVVCGFFAPSLSLSKKQGNSHIGPQPVQYMWFSFPCIRIPNWLAGEFVAWFENVARAREKYAERIQRGKSDDFFWRQFMKEEHEDMCVFNLVPNLVDHVDYLLGGSLINTKRTDPIMRSGFWEHEDLVTELQERISRIKTPPEGGAAGREGD